MKRILLILNFFICAAAFAQTGKGTIQGTIQNIQQAPVAGATVSLRDTKYHVVADDNGSFMLRNVPAGNYTLTVSGTGYNASTQNITVQTGRTLSIDLQMNGQMNELTEVKISSNRKNRKDEASAIAARMPLTYLENPQVTNTVSHQLITEQALTDFSGILRNVPGVTKSWSSTNTYYSSRGFNTRSYFRNGVEAYAESELDPANLEQMQAIKGPSGTLFGGPLTSFGGLFNRVTKKPFENRAVEIGYQMGSYNQSRLTADINTPLDTAKNVLFRFNGATTYQASFQDQGFLQSYFLAPSLTYKVSDRLSISLDMEFYNREATSQQQITVSGPLDNLKRYSDYKRSYSNNSVTLKNPFIAFYGVVNYKISPSWASQTNITRTQGANTGNYLTFTLLADSLLVRTVGQYPTSRTGGTNIQQNFIGDFKIGSLRNRIVAGVDFYEYSSNFSSNVLNGRGGRPNFDTLNIKHAMPNYGLIGPNTISNKLNSFAATYSSSQQDVYSAYASDVLNITPALSLMASLRVDRFSSKGTYSPATGTTTGSYDQTALAPKFGIVYQIIKDRVSLYGNYMGGFQNTSGTDVNNVAFRPQYANQWEGGIKTDLYGDKLSLTLSYYDIRVENTLRPDPNNTGFSIQDGTQYSRGYEFDIMSRPVKGLTITVGGAHNNSLITNADASVNNMRPVNSGPVSSGTLWASYSIPTGNLSGLGIGFGGTYSGENIISTSKAAGTFYTDAYTLLNGGVFFNQARYRISLNADNLTDKQYYTTGFGTVTPGMLRRVILGLSVKF